MKIFLALLIVVVISLIGSYGIKSCKDPFKAYWIGIITSIVAFIIGCNLVVYY